MYNITGWSGGGRRPLSYNLMPGQFRNTRVNVFSNPTIINNNIGGFGGCYDYGDCGCGGSNKMSWMDWTMMGGMLLNGLGNMFACFWGGGGGGKVEAEETPKTDDKTLRTQAKELAGVYGVEKEKVSVIDGTIRVNINGKVIPCENLDELEEALSGAQEKSDGTGGLSEDPRAEELAAIKAQVEALQQNAKTTAAPPTTANPTSFTNVLFKPNTSGLTSTELEENKFRELTGSEPYKITANANGITITAVSDKGNKTTKTGTINITNTELSELLKAPDTEITLPNFGGKTTKAKNLGGYLQIQVGTQTYIVGTDNKAYQYKDGNVTGYNETNWRRGS